MSTIRIFALMACSLALGQLVVLCKEQKKQELCGNGRIKLQSIADLERTTTDECADNVKKAFDALKVLVEEQNVCTMDKANNITQYYKDYLSDSDWQASKSKAQILIKKFAIAYGMQTSSACRLGMAYDFFKTASTSLKDSDFEAIKEWTKDDSPIARLLGAITKSGEFLLPSDFAALAPEMVDRLKLKMKEDSGKILYVQGICEKRFRPLYEPIVMPIAHLARNGIKYNRLFNEQSISLELWTNEKYALWARIVFVCESLKDIVVTEAPTGSTGQPDYAVDYSKTGTVESLIFLPVVKRFKPFRKIDGYAGTSKPKLNEAKRYPLYSSANFRLRTAMRSYNVTMSETERFRKRLLSNKWGLLLATFKSNEQTKTLLKKAFGLAVASVQRGRHQNQELESAKKDLLGIVDAKKNSLIFRILAKILKGGMMVVWAFAFLLEVALMLLVAVTIFTTASIDIVSVVITDKPIVTGTFLEFLDAL